MKARVNHKSFKFIKTKGGISEYVHKKNGLQVLLLEDHSTPTATFNVLYRVGSRNEAVGCTGATHLLEHLMFKGAKKYNKERGNDIWTNLQGIGAQLNATTWFDRTNYYATVSSDKIDLVMDIEADRMRGAFIREKDRRDEMTVVRNEFEWHETDPLETVDMNVWAAAFREHPYHHPTIGWRSDIEGVSIGRLREFYDTFYQPNNATAMLVGDFSAKEALSMIERRFGRIPRGKQEIPEVYTVEPEQQGQRRIVVERAGESNIVMIGHKVPAARHRDIPALLCLYDILGSGKTSRLYRKYVDTAKVQSAGVSTYPTHDPGLFTMNMTARKNVRHETMEDMLQQEIMKIKVGGITAKELNVAKKVSEADRVYRGDGSAGVVNLLNEAVAWGDWTLYHSLSDLSKVQVQDVKRVANQYWSERASTVGYFMPKAAN